MVSHLALRQERRTPDRTTPPAPQQPAQPAARETKATRDRKMVRRAEHRDTGVSTNGNRVGSPDGYVRGKQEIFEPLLAVPQTRTIRPSLTSLHNSACRTNPIKALAPEDLVPLGEQGYQIWGSSRSSRRLCDRLNYA
jgi:hypothetical protein